MSPLIASLLSKRGVTDVEAFLNPDYTDDDETDTDAKQGLLSQKQNFQRTRSIRGAGRPRRGGNYTFTRVGVAEPVLITFGVRGAKLPSTTGWLHPTVVQDLALGWMICILKHLGQAVCGIGLLPERRLLETIADSLCGARFTTHLLKRKTRSMRVYLLQLLLLYIRHVKSFPHYCG
jgi:hypothetical protein